MLSTQSQTVLVAEPEQKHKRSNEGLPLTQEGQSSCALYNLGTHTTEECHKLWKMSDFRRRKHNKNNNNNNNNGYNNNNGNNGNRNNDAYNGG